MNLLMQSVANAPTVDIRHLPKTADREDFLVRVTDDRNDYSFKLSITGSLIAMWATDSDEAAKFLVDRILYSHGTASGFEEEGYWFDSYSSSSTFVQTIHDIENKGARFFDHPSIRTELGSKLFGVLDRLDEARSSIDGQPFIRSLDALFERSQGGDDFESDAPDHAHFIYRICLLAAVIDRFNFVHDQGSLNGLKNWLTDTSGPDTASELTRTFYMVRNLRRQYPIHEQYKVDSDGSRSRRADLEQAEMYFGVTREPANDWHVVRTKFVEALESLYQALGTRATAEPPVS